MLLCAGMARDHSQIEFFPWPLRKNKILMGGEGILGEENSLNKVCKLKDKSCVQDPVNWAGQNRMFMLGNCLRPGLGRP